MKVIWDSESERILEKEFVKLAEKLVEGATDSESVISLEFAMRHCGRGYSSF